MTDSARIFAEAWKWFASRFPSPTIVEGDGVATCYGNVPLLFFNLWVQTRPLANREQLGALLATAAARPCAQPAGGVVCEDWLPRGWEEALVGTGLAPMMALTSMEANELLPPRRPLAEIEIRRVTDEATARDLAMLNALAYGMPVELFDCIATASFWPAGSDAFVGYVNGQPVSTASTLPVAGTVYVALVATHPGAQGRGYAETVMRHAVTAGQRSLGVQRTTLHASDMGRPVYQAMGYATGPRLILVAPSHAG